ncbi:MAG: TolC family protein, partial [Alphaproteobacteria bacterium]|nr:TolC family protein [Alphaproteobacteria bacterium]
AEVQLLQRSPTLKEANEVIVRGEAETASAKAALFPNVSLQAGLSQSNAGIEVTNQQYITMNMSMTLFNGGQTILQQTQTLAALKRARYLSADTRNNLLQDLHNRWQAYNSYESIVADRYKNLQQYQRVYEGARATFALGQITITSLIEVRQQLLTQYINYATALNSRMVYGLSIVNICNLID